MAEHTRGRLEFDGDREGMPLVDEVRVTLGERGSDLYREDMRRLVACWNACIGLATEGLEHVDLAGDDNLRLARLAAVAQRTFLDNCVRDRKLVGALFDGLTRLVGAVESGYISREHVMDARAVLGKVTGGP